MTLHSVGLSAIVGICLWLHVSLKEENISDTAATCAAMTAGSENFLDASDSNSEQSLDSFFH